MLRHHEAECVEQLLEFGRRRLDTASRPPYPETASVSQWFESAHLRNTDPMHPALGSPSLPPSHGDRCAATGLGEPGKTPLHRFGIFWHTGDHSGVVHTDDDKSAIRVSERADCPSNLGEIAQFAIEVHRAAFTLGDGPLHCRPVRPHTATSPCSCTIQSSASCLGVASSDTTRGLWWNGWGMSRLADQSNLGWHCSEGCRAIERYGGDSSVLRRLCRLRPAVGAIPSGIQLQTAWLQRFFVPIDTPLPS